MAERYLIRRRNLVKWLAAAPALSTACASVPASESVIRYLDTLSETLIPGSAQTAPGQTINDRLDVGWLGIKPTHILNVMTQLDRTSGSSLLKISAEERVTLITEFDQQCFAGELDSDTTDSWKAVKTVLMSSYFTSEEGASRQLTYAPVPGQWLPDIPVEQATPAMSNDWLAVWFS